MSDMHVIYVDDEELAITRFRVMADKLEEIKNLTTFQNPEEALDYAHNNQVDLAFLDMEMPEMSGLKLAKELQKVNKNIRIIFITAYNQYALDAFEVNAAGYLMKPYSMEKLEHELKKALRIKDVAEHKVFIQTIPSFDIFVDDEVLVIGRQKVKELLALLVDKRGGTLTAGQAISFLWEDRPDDDATKSLYRMTVKRMRDLLSEHKIAFILDDSNTQKALKPDEFTCDYYEILKGNEKYMSLYYGEYMVEYGWAEDTNAMLSEMLDI